MMLSKEINIEGLSLAYLETNAYRPNTIFFIHGGSSSSLTWMNQLNHSVFAPYRLIAFDLPAHGRSAASPFPEEQYGLADLGRIIGQAINNLVPSQSFLVVGSSLGTNILCEALPGINPRGIVLAAPCIVGEHHTFSTIGTGHVDPSALFEDEATDEMLRTFYANSLVQNREEVIPLLLEDYKKVKSPFRSVMFRQSTGGGRLSDEIAMLKNYQASVLVVFGKEEAVINPHYLDAAGLNVWRNNIFKIPEAGHLLHLDQPEAFNRLVIEYAREIFKEPRV